jgi:hypothetical protein
VDGLLDDYCSMAQATPEEMAGFVATYGLPEVNDAMFPNAKDKRRLSERAQDWRSLKTRELRLHARGVASARRIGARLVVRRHGSRDDWADVINNLSLSPGLRLPASDVFGDYKLERELFAEVLSDFLDDAEVTLMADWLGSRGLALEPTTRTLVGVVAILLAREVGAEGAYSCDACGAQVHRQRPPRAGESVYCTRVECKREQQRINQAKWRAKKRERGE